MIPILSGILGAMIGSFLNVAIYRIPHPTLSVSKPKRSMCPRCGVQIAARDNIPILSYLLLRGRCRGCSVRIPPRYVGVEAFTAVLFVVIALVRPPFTDTTLGVGLGERLALFAVHLFMISTAVTVSGIDWDLRRIPDSITLPLMLSLPVVSLLLPALQDHRQALVYATLEQYGAPSALASYGTSVLGGLFGIFVFWGLARILVRLFGAHAVGLGDVKYMAVIGVYLGPERALTVFILASVIGAIGGLGLMVMRGTRTVAFGPFLSLAMVAMVLWGDPILDGLWRWPQWLMAP